MGDNFGVPDWIIKNHEISPIIARFGTWVVTEYGLESVKPGWEYYIEWDRIEELDWPSHMTEKPWVNRNDFMSALEYALEHKPE